jgi:hypothetical protein
MKETTPTGKRSGENNPMFGRHHSEEARRKISNAFRGENNPQYGKPLSEETRKKISQSLKGKIFSEEHCNNLSKSLKGRTFSENALKKMSKAKEGIIPSEETRKKISERARGAGNSRWLGGVSFEPYCPMFTKELRERVREFFGYTCVECGAPQNGERLHIHHVNFNKQSCCDRSIPLFVPLCRSCHGKTHINREYWEQHFTKIINEQYDGQCYLPKNTETSMVIEDAFPTF